MTGLSVLTEKEMKPGTKSLFKLPIWVPNRGEEKECTCAIC